MSSCYNKYISVYSGFDSPDWFQDVVSSPTEYDRNLILIIVDNIETIPFAIL